MSSRLWGRRRALAAGTGTGTVIALLVAAILFVIAAPGVPSAWWPQTGDAFASSPSAPSDAVTTPVQGAAHGQAPAATPSHESEVCDAIVGPAHSYCLGAPAPQSSSGKITLADAWPLGVLGVGIAALFIVSRRGRGL
ncbi:MULTISPECIES: hypothetical protein [unclassified Streptomyces]|uniref:hypothetical protein n=1 Tax=unclassified Streptomyces TaxID=2593676 RepID=UPI002DDB60BD|nr:hypothetical protein [Streptomyces sp. NBC_01445]WSE03806.1 hypothetical protein OG574_10750 [Streptomyces sp. NBC_01445]